MMPKTRVEDRVKFSTGHLATLIQASRTTIVRWIEEGRLRARRTVGGWYIIPRDEVINFLWDLSFSKETPRRIWRAATLAYEEMTQTKPESAGKAKTTGKSKKSPTGNENRNEHEGEPRPVASRVHLASLPSIDRFIAAII